MARYNYDRLSAQDNSFLLFETRNLPMHVSSTLVFDAGPLRTPDGGVDFDAIRRATQASLHRIPRYRQKLRAIPLEGSPVWVDDEHFELDYHAWAATDPALARFHPTAEDDDGIIETVTAGLH